MERVCDSATNPIRSGVEGRTGLHCAMRPIPVAGGVLAHPPRHYLFPLEPITSGRNREQATGRAHLGAACAILRVVESRVDARHTNASLFREGPVPLLRGLRLSGHRRLDQVALFLNRGRGSTVRPARVLPQKTAGRRSCLHAVPTALSTTLLGVNGANLVTFDYSWCLGDWYSSNQPIPNGTANLTSGSV